MSQIICTEHVTFEYEAKFLSTHSKLTYNGRSSRPTLYLFLLCSYSIIFVRVFEGYIHSLGYDTLRACYLIICVYNMRLNTYNDIT